MISLRELKIGRSSLLGLASLLWSIGLVSAQVPPAPAHLIVHMLDYVAVDYPECVQDGVVLDQAEYDEQLEFAQQVRTMLDQLPTHRDRTSLLRLADELINGIQGKRPGLEVAALAQAAALVNHSRLRCRGGPQASSRFAHRCSPLSSPMRCLPWSRRPR